MTSTLTRRRRAQVALRWPLGMALTTWRYLWRTTPLHRRVEAASAQDMEPELRPDVSEEGLQRLASGRGPLFHRCFAIVVEGSRLSARQLIDRLAGDPNAQAPVEVAVFTKTAGSDGRMEVGDEFVVQMPGPWNGPVRVVDRTATSFRLATLQGHLEAGQIEFRAEDDGERLRFGIDSWTTSGDRLSLLLYTRIRLAKEMQLHMWVHFCERVAEVAGGRLASGVHITTRRLDGPLPGSPVSGGPAGPGTGAAR